MERGKRDRRALENHEKMLGAIRLFFLLVLVLAMPALAQERTCPPRFNDSPATESHFDQASMIEMPFEKVFAAGQQFFVANFKRLRQCRPFPHKSRFRTARSITTQPKPPRVSFRALGTLLKSRSHIVRQARKAKTKVALHVLMELAIAELNARLLAGDR